MHRLLLLSLICTTAVFSMAKASNILGFAMAGGRSHHMNIVRIGQELAERGHNFSMLVSDKDDIGTETLSSKGFPGLQVHTFRGPLHIGTEKWASELSRDPRLSVHEMLSDEALLAKYLFEDKVTLANLKNVGFDLILRDVVSWPAAVLTEFLDIPSTAVFPIPVVLPIFEDEQSVPNPLAYVPQLGAGFTSEMTFWQRLQNYIQYQLVKNVVRARRANVAEFAKQTGLKLRFYDKGISTAAAVIATVDWALEFPQPMPPRIHMVGPVLAEDAKLLPSELSTFLKSGQTEGLGAIFVSMGTLARLSHEEACSMAHALSALPNPVLWKLDPLHLRGNTTVDSLGLADNIKVITWAPQNDVLGHPAVKAFVTQAGINSLYEAAYHAVPIVAVPLIADQDENAAKARHNGFGITVRPGHMVSSNGKALQQAIGQVLQDTSFALNATKVSKRLLNKPRHPVQLAADVVERVLMTGGDAYLETRHHALHWWQLCLLDVKLAIAAAAVLCLGLLAYLGHGIVQVLAAGCAAAYQSSTAKPQPSRQKVA